MVSLADEHQREWRLIPRFKRLSYCAKCSPAADPSPPPHPQYLLWWCSLEDVSGLSEELWEGLRSGDSDETLGTRRTEMAAEQLTQGG